jgi:hypothetical protein
MDLPPVGIQAGIFAVVTRSPLTGANRAVRSVVEGRRARCRACTAGQKTSTFSSSCSVSYDRKCDARNVGPVLVWSGAVG